MKAGNRMKTETTNSFEEIAAREEQFQLATYKKFPFAPVGGRGSWVETSEGERYLDLYGGHAVCATFLGKYRETGRPNVPGHLCAEFGSVESVAALADETVAAVCLEPIQSMAGVRMAQPEFFRELRRLCDERGVLLIFDEVQTGMGRTGEWFFAGSEAAGRVVPDVITLAKAQIG